MEVSGIEGNYRTTCENTMRVMRSNRESLLAILEAFVYDPLISFRLLNPKMFKKRRDEDETADRECTATDDPGEDVSGGATKQYCTMD